MSLPVYRIEFISQPRNHHALFIQHGDDGNGDMYHVVGSIESDSDGMELQVVGCDTAPMYKFPSYHDWVQLGVIDEDDVSRFEAVLYSVPPPARQFDENGYSLTGEPLRRCREWIAEVVDELWADGVLKSG